MIHDWRRNKDGSYTDLNQEVSWEKILDWEQKLYVWSCFLYYKLADPVLSDENFEAIEKLLERYWDNLHPSLQARLPKGAMKTTAHAMGFTEQEQIEALEWAQKVRAMQITTVRNKPKSFSWSYSKIKNFETCPKRYYLVDVMKKFKEEEGEALLWGNIVHKALADRLDKKTPLPHTMQEYEKWCARIDNPASKLLVEQKLAITKDFGPTEFFSNDAWYRGIGDAIKISGPVALIVDWKTGKILEDGSQLALMAACVFAHHPQVQRVRSEFIWLKEDASTRADFSRADMVNVWKGLFPRIEALEHAHSTTTFPPKPGGLCKRWCVVTDCPHHGS